MANSEKTRLVRMEIENFMKCRLVQIQFGDDPVTEIRGSNAAGKSSVLRAFWALVGGKDELPAKPLRDGAESGHILGELDNGLVIRRRFTASGNSYLDVQTKDGAEYKSPQKILDELVGRISFDPLAFLGLDGKKQAVTLRKLSGVDFTILDGKRKVAYDARTDANRAVTQARARLTALPEVEAPDALVSAADLLQEQDARRVVFERNEAKRRALKLAREVYADRQVAVGKAQDDVARLERELAAARERLSAAELAREKEAQAGASLRHEVESLVDPDMDAIPEQLRAVEATNDRVRAKKAHAAAAAELARAEAEAARLDAEVTAIDEQKEAVLAQANFPVAGLGFGEDGITYNGQPFDQASQAERIRVSMAMGLALNPKLPVVCIRDGSLLDDDSRLLVRRMAREAGAQVLLEIVGKGGSGIVIEDGQVEGAPAPAEVA
jgi:hypothetical protein